jgi:large subunit ribosomal protein L35
MKVKNKPHRGTKKRIKVSATGKLQRRMCGASHIMTKKTSKKKRSFRKDAPVATADVGRTRRLLGL